MIVQAYQADDGSLHKTKEECDQRNKEFGLEAKIRQFMTAHNTHDQYFHIFAKRYIAMWELWKEENNV